MVTEQPHPRIEIAPELVLGHDDLAAGNRLGHRRGRFRERTQRGDGFGFHPDVVGEQFTGAGAAPSQSSQSNVPEVQSSSALVTAAVTGSAAGGAPGVSSQIRSPSAGNSALNSE
ncbi:hypothetical protein P9209_14580 [Prescottella defluvii]|nr:hypothetical protein P9209_14580 [Prescottella defluvii]